jgi:hypothetical protein
MTVEQRLNDAVTDLEYVMSEGTDFSDALIIISNEYGFSAEGLMSEIKRRFGRKPENAILFRIEENKQAAILSRIWNIYPRTGILIYMSKAPSSFREKIFSEAGVDLRASLNSISDFKMRTDLLQELENRYRNSLGLG